MPIIEENKPANVVNSRLIIPQLRKVRDEFDFHIGAVIVDLALDSVKVLSFIIRNLESKLSITHNKRKEKDFPVSKDGNRVFLGGFKMLYWGKYREEKKTRIKFVCPIIYFNRKFKKVYDLLTGSERIFFRLLELTMLNRVLEVYELSLIIIQFPILQFY